MTEKDILFVTRYGGSPRDLFNAALSGGFNMSTTIQITFTDIEPGRVRAMIEVEDTFVGVYAEAGDPQTAAAQAVKAWQSMQHTPAEPEPDIWPVRFSRQRIKDELEAATEDQEAIRIVYSDAEGHETERVIHPSSINEDLGMVYAFDDLRGHWRAFRLDRIESAQRLS